MWVPLCHGHSNAAASCQEAQTLAPQARRDKVIRNQIDIRMHSVDGMPICKHCGRNFGSWTTFKVHIAGGCLRMGNSATGSCGVGQNGKRSVSAGQSAAGHSQRPALQSAAGPLLTEALLDIPEVTQLLLKPTWQSALQMPVVQLKLRNFCGICGQWVSEAPSALRNHVRRIHLEAWKLSSDAAHLSSISAITKQALWRLRGRHLKQYSAQVQHDVPPLSAEAPCSGTEEAYVDFGALCRTLRS